VRANGELTSRDCSSKRQRRGPRGGADADGERRRGRSDRPSSAPHVERIADDEYDVIPMNSTRGMSLIRRSRRRPSPEDASKTTPFLLVSSIIQVYLRKYVRNLPDFTVHQICDIDPFSWRQGMKTALFGSLQFNSFCFKPSLRALGLSCRLRALVECAHTTKTLDTLETIDLV